MNFTLQVIKFPFKKNPPFTCKDKKAYIFVHQKRVTILIRNMGPLPKNRLTETACHLIKKKKSGSLINKKSQGYHGVLEENRRSNFYKIFNLNSPHLSLAGGFYRPVLWPEPSSRENSNSFTLTRHVHLNERIRQAGSKGKPVLQNTSKQWSLRWAQLVRVWC